MRLWGTLRSFGTTLKDAIKFQTVEITLMNIIAWLISLVIVSAFVAFLDIANAPWYVIFPFEVTILSMLFVVLFCVILSNAILRKFFKKQIHDLLRIPQYKTFSAFTSDFMKKVFV